MGPVHSHMKLFARSSQSVESVVHQDDVRVTMGSGSVSGSRGDGVNTFKVMQEMSAARALNSSTKC